MQLTWFTDYSLRVLMYLSMNQDRLCTTAEIADRFRISKNHVIKVVHNLSRLGYIKSAKGRGGGICLLKKASDINLRDLIVVLEPNLGLVECFENRTNTCRIIAACKLKGVLGEALKAFLEVLEKYTIADTVSRPDLFRSIMEEKT